MPEKEESGSIKRALVIFPGALGDLVCFLPVLRVIARPNRGASVELMARFELARLAAGRTVVAHGHSIDARAVGALFADETALDARRFFVGFDHIYSFFAADDSGFRARLAAATDGEVSFYPFRPGGEGHVAEAYLRAIETDETAWPADTRLEPTADDFVATARVLAESKCDRSNLIVIFPGSGSPGKNWPAVKFAALASMLSLSKRASVVVILGPAEMALEPIFRQAGLPVLKELDLPTVAAIARLALAFVGNDSGVAHLAAAVGGSGVAIFGPTDPARWAPRPAAGGRISILRRDPIDSIEVGEVARVLAKFVEQRQK